MGTWRPGQVHIDWHSGAWQPPASQLPAISSAWQQQTSRPGVHLFDGSLARLQGFSGGNPLVLRLIATSYRMFLGTNGRSPGPGMDDELANPLGTSAVVITADQRLLLGRRSQAVALHPGCLHPFGGCIEVGETDVFASIARELHEELGVRDPDLMLLALVREPLLRQPELLFTAHVAATEAELRATLDPAEHSELYSTSASAPQLPDDLTPIARAAIAAHLRQH